MPEPESHDSKFESPSAASAPPEPTRSTADADSRVEPSAVAPSAAAELERAAEEALERLKAPLRRRGLWPRPRLLKALARLAENLPTCGNDLDVIHNGDEFYSRLFADLDAAQQRISIEMYMILGDTTGLQFAKRLAACAQRGVEVRLVFDAVGCLGTPNSLFKLLSAAGVSLLEYHPIAPWRGRFAIFRRNHRKNIVIDGRVGYTGGMNIGDYWLARNRGGAAWRDTHARVEGPAAGDLEMLFVQTWHMECGELLQLPRTVPRESAGIGNSRRQPQIYVMGSHAPMRRQIRRMYLLSLGRSRHQVTITCSYFVPDFKLRRALRKAVERNVRVRLLLPQKSDVAVSQLASESNFSKLLRWGVEIYQWKPSVLHAKTAVIDGSWSTIGSSNLDGWSLTMNRETNLVIVDPVEGEALEKAFDADLEHADALTLEQWNKRPWSKRLLEMLASLFRHLL